MDAPFPAASPPSVFSLLPHDLDASARSCGLLRRRRGVRDAASLLRILLAYAGTDMGFRSLAAWAREGGLSETCPEALFRHVARCAPWLEALLRHGLAARAPAAPPTGLRVRVVDASVLCAPGAKGTEWRVHALYDAEGGALSGVELTDAKGGESLARFPGGSGFLLLGDRGLGHARGYLAAREAGSHVLVRVQPTNVRLLDDSGRRFDLAAWARDLPREGTVSLFLTLPGPEGERERVRLVGRRGEGGAPTVLMTSLLEGPSDEDLLALYRLRWQVELEFKRLKSLLGLSALPSRGPTARSWVLARLLLAVLSEGLLARPTKGGGSARGASGESSSSPSGR